MKCVQLSRRKYLWHLGPSCTSGNSLCFCSLDWDAAFLWWHACYHAMSRWRTSWPLKLITLFSWVRPYIPKLELCSSVYWIYDLSLFKMHYFQPSGISSLLSFWEEVRSWECPRREIWKPRKWAWEGNPSAPETPGFVFQVLPCGLIFHLFSNDLVVKWLLWGDQYNFRRTNTSYILTKWVNYNYTSPPPHPQVRVRQSMFKFQLFQLPAMGSYGWAFQVA